MKTSIRNKKGFTIVELVIVIAVIAILAAVLIPTFANLVEKANQSADIQAVRQMNTYLAIDEIDSNKTIQDVYDALAEGGMSAENYTPLQSGTYFFWVPAENRVVYTDKDYQVIFPEEYKTLSKDATWLSLGGAIKGTAVTIATDGTATVTNAEELYWLSEHMGTVETSSLKKIVINTDKIDLNGANISFSITTNNELTISGKEGGTTLTGHCALDYKFTDQKNNKDKNYASGFVALVEKGATCTIENIILDGATVGGLEIGGVGALVGRINDNANVTIKNCKVNNSIVYGKNKVGALVGSIALGTTTVKIEGCEIEKCTVNCSEGESGMAIGCVYNGGTDTSFSIDKAFSEWVKESTLNLVSTKREVKTDKVTYDESGTTVDDCQKIVHILTAQGVPETKDNLERYRMFAADAYMTAQHDSVYSIMINNTANSITSLKTATKKIGQTEIDIQILKFFK